MGLGCVDTEDPDAESPTVVVADVDGIAVDYSDHRGVSPTGGVGVADKGRAGVTRRQQPRANTRTTMRRIRTIGSLFALDLGLFHIETLPVSGCRRTA